jgi:hypothetical protein
MNEIKEPKKTETILANGVKEITWFEIIDGITYYVQEMHEGDKITTLKSEFKMPPFTL